MYSELLIGIAMLVGLFHFLVSIVVSVRLFRQGDEARFGRKFVMVWVGSMLVSAVLAVIHAAIVYPPSAIKAPVWFRAVNAAAWEIVLPALIGTTWHLALGMWQDKPIPRGLRCVYWSVWACVVLWATLGNYYLRFVYGN